MKRFNTTGLCIPDKHFMVDTTEKLNKTIKLIEYGEYFIINRPRQYGKTTTIFLLQQRLGNEYFIIKTSFEGVGDVAFTTEEKFAKLVLTVMGDAIERIYPKLAEFLFEKAELITDFKSVGKVIAQFIDEIDKKLVIFIDEVDKSSNNQLFLSFIGMLRDKYLLASEGRDKTFHSVVLAGVHDIKNLKLKLRPDEERKYNSPWNIAADYKVDLTFSSKEISTMLLEYQKAKNVKMDIKEISELLYFYTSGHPFLVSKICQTIDEEFENEIQWKEEDIIEAVKLITKTPNTNFDSMIKNIENNDELSELVKGVMFGYETNKYSIFDFTIRNTIEQGYLILDENNYLKVHNKMYEEVLRSHFISVSVRKKLTIDSVQSTYIKPDGRLDIKKVLLKFQEALVEKYSKNDNLLIEKSFLERDLRLLFLTFLKPIINGIGFSYKEVTISEEKRLDVVILFMDEKFIVELKIWRGEEYHKEGISQLKDYMKKEHTENGYLLIADKRKDKKWRETTEEGIFTIWV
jgi:hypothetical protein